MTKDEILARLPWLWGVVFVVAVLEILCQWHVPEKGPDPQSWKAAARDIAAEKQGHDLVVIAPKWATEGRMYLGSLISFGDLGRFDTTRYDRVFEVSVGGARVDTWRHLEPESETRFGEITVRRFRLDPKAEVLYDFVAEVGSAQVEPASAGRAAFVIDHRFCPRYGIRVPLKGGRASLTFTAVPLNGVLSGYGVIDYRNARYDRGGPVGLAVYVNDEKIGGAEFRNFSPERPFELPLSGQGRGTVRFEVRAADGLNRVFALAADVRRQGRRTR